MKPNRDNERRPWKTKKQNNNDNKIKPIERSSLEDPHNLDDNMAK